MLKVVDKSKYPSKLVLLAEHHKDVCSLIDDEDWGDEYMEEWKETYNALSREEKKILDELLRMPDYEEVRQEEIEEIYEAVEKMAVRLRKSKFSHKQIREYIRWQFKVKLDFDDREWIRRIFQDVDGHDTDYKTISALTQSEIQEVIQKVGSPRRTGNG